MHFDIIELICFNYTYYTLIKYNLEYIVRSVEPILELLT